MPYDSPVNSVANTLQGILARKRVDSRQNFLDSILSRKTDSEIAGQQANSGYLGKLGENIDFDNTREMAGDVAPEAAISGLDPRVGNYFRGIGAIKPGATPNVSTAVLDDAGNLIDETSSQGVAGPDVYAGNQTYRDKQAAEAKHAALIAASPDIEKMSPLQRALVLQHGGAAGPVSDDIQNPGNIFTAGPTGKITKGPSVIGPNMLTQLGFNPADTALATFRAQKDAPDYSDPTPGRHPATGEMGNFIWDKNHPDRGAIPTMLGLPPKQEGIETTLLQGYAQSMGGDKANPEQARIYEAGILQNATPAVQDLIGRVRGGNYTPPNIPLVLSPAQRAIALPLPTDDAPTKAKKIGRLEGLSPAEIQQFAEYLSLFPSAQ